MTSAEMHISVNLSLQKIGSYNRGELQTEEVDHYLNRAQERYVKANIGSNVNLRTVLQENVLIPLISSLPEMSQYEYVFSYPPDYLDYISSATRYTRTGPYVVATQEYVDNVLIPASEAILYRYNANNKPYLRNPRIFLERNFGQVITDYETTADQLRLLYVRLPQNIVLDADPFINRNCELPDHTHEEIVQIAVAMMIQDLGVSNDQ